jgi:hypothetical protein
VRPSSRFYTFVGAVIFYSAFASAILCVFLLIGHAIEN